MKRMAFGLCKKDENRHSKLSAIMCIQYPNILRYISKRDIQMGEHVPIPGYTRCLGFTPEHSREIM
uniref:Uncharacterized protein n=1 Tax=Romanomermis culicivorax TaxID=13658 RepID=A0A915J9Q3_ROMCU